ncbi:MAG: NCS2 family permease [Bacilli bacterium]|nr:NCS2 family permease [Bacilli bacterium]
MKFFDKLFHLKENNATIKNEIIGGLVTFIAMCYILPVNSTILAAMGMNQAGVFAMTALISCLVSLIMGLVANYPIALSAGMGLNAYITYTIALGAGYSWQQAMILLTIAGIIFFILSLTPIRKWIVDAIPTSIKYIISASLGAFICFVGLRNSGIIISGSTLVEMGNLANPAVLIALLCIILCFGLMFSRNKVISSLAIPISILVAAIAGVTTSSIMIATSGKSVAEFMAANPNLPIAPWLRNDLSWGMSGVKDVLFFGTLTGSSNFGKDLVKIFTTPASYIAIFSLILVNLFNTTATLLAVSRNAGMIDENGRLKNYRKVIIADATGSLICAPLGTSTVTPFAESNVGVGMGAKTGLSTIVVALMFLLSAFIYPIFSIFVAGSVTAPALVCIGALIFVNNLKDIDWQDQIIGFTAFITLIFTLLCYSIASGIGLGLIIYCVMMLFAKRKKEVPVAIYVIALLFIISFIFTAIMPYLNKSNDGIAGMKIFFGW